MILTFYILDQYVFEALHVRNHFDDVEQRLSSSVADVLLQSLPGEGLTGRAHQYGRDSHLIQSAKEIQEMFFNEKYFLLQPAYFSAVSPHMFPGTWLVWGKLCL